MICSAPALPASSPPPARWRAFVLPLALVAPPRQPRVPAARLRSAARLSAAGPRAAFVRSPVPLPACRQVQPAAGNGLARRLVASAKHCFCRSRRRMAASPVRRRTGRRARFAPCVAALSCRKCRFPSLLFMIKSLLLCRRHRRPRASVAARSHIHPAGDGVVTVRLRRCLRLTAPRPRHRQFLPVCRHHPPLQHAETVGGSCLVIANRQLLPGEGVGLACLRLTVPVRLRSAILAATFPDSPPPAGAPRPEARPPMSSQSRPSRSPARLDPWTLAALLSALRPLPPAPLFPRCADALRSEAAICGRTGASVPACGLRWRSTCASLTAVDCFPGPFRIRAAIPIGDTPRPLRAGDRGPTLTVDSIRSLSATPAAVSPCGALAAPVAGVRRLPVRPAFCTRTSRRPRASRSLPATASPGSGQVDTRAV